MNYSIICGSPRKNSESMKVCKYIEAILTHKRHEVSLIDLSSIDLSQKKHIEQQLHEQPDVKGISNILKMSTCLVLIFPEYNGMAPTVVKDFLSFSTSGEIAHKPALLISVSSGLGGCYSLAELRMNSHQNTLICYIPNQLTIRKVGSVLNDFNEASSKEDLETRNKIKSNLVILEEYGKALATMRESSINSILLSSIK